MFVVKMGMSATGATFSNRAETIHSCVFLDCLSLSDKSTSLYLESVLIIIIIINNIIIILNEVFVASSPEDINIILGYVHYSPSPVPPPSIANETLTTH